MTTKLTAADPAMREAKCYDDGKRHGFTDGAEAIRAACREAVQEWARKEGAVPGDPQWDGLMAAIDNAAPTEDV